MIGLSLLLRISFCVPLYINAEGRLRISEQSDDLLECQCQFCQVIGADPSVDPLLSTLTFHSIIN